MCTRQGSCVAACVEQVDLIAVCELLADFLRTFCGLAADSEGVLDDPHIAFTDSRSREPQGRVPTWQGRRTTGARPLTHQGPDRGTYRRAPLRTGTSCGPRTCGRSWSTVGTAAPSALAGRTRGHLPGPGDSIPRGSH